MAVAQHSSVEAYSSEEIQTSSKARHLTCAGGAWSASNEPERGNRLGELSYGRQGMAVQRLDGVSADPAVIPALLEATFAKGAE